MILRVRRAPRARSGIAMFALAALFACDRGAETAPPPEAAEPEIPAPTAPAPAAPVAPPAPQATHAAPLSPHRQALIERARGNFGVLPSEATSSANPVTAEKIELGRMLYYDARLSKNHDIACSDCHKLDRFGVDGERTSPGHKGQRGTRNSPTVLNAALQVAQFWDGRAPSVEQQAKEQVLKPVEMAMSSDAAVVAMLESIPGYAPLFKAAFPGAVKPITYDNMARAIGAFERRLITPSPFDEFLAGDATALDDAQMRGLEIFLDTGCGTCHQGVGIGGGMFQKLGAALPYPTSDEGRAAVTHQEVDKYFFKVPMLRNVAKTAPYFHDGSLATLDEAIRTMARIQLGNDLADDRVTSIRAFLESLTGTVDGSYVARPVLPQSGPDTPKADPS